MDPINYGAAFANTPNPFDSFAKGMALGNSVQAQIDAVQQARAQAEQARMLEEARQRVTSGNASAEDRVNYLSMVAPEQSKAMQDAFGQMDKTLLQDANKAALNVATAIDTGSLDVAKQILETRAQGYINQGTPEGKQQADYINNVLIKGLDSSPESVKGHLLDLVAFSPDGKTAIDAYNSNKKLGPDIAYTEALTLKALADARKAQIDSRSLPQDVRQSVNESAKQAIYYGNLANSYSTLSKKFDKNESLSGLTGEAFKRGAQALGIDLGVGGDLYNQYQLMRTDGALDKLSRLPGAASNKDMEVVMAGWPKPTDSPDVISRFLKGLGTVAKYNAQISSAEAKWKSKNFDLGTAREDMDIGGREVKAGESYDDFINKNFSFSPSSSAIGDKTPSGSASATGAAAPKPTGKITVNTPGGAFEFNTQAEADLFKKKAGIK